MSFYFVCAQPNSEFECVTTTMMDEFVLSGNLQSNNFQQKSSGHSIKFGFLVHAPKSLAKRIAFVETSYSQ